VTYKLDKPKEDSLYAYIKKNTPIEKKENKLGVLWTEGPVLKEIILCDSQTECLYDYTGSIFNQESSAEKLTLF
jgi:hypothetical protein